MLVIETRNLKVPFCQSTWEKQNSPMLTRKILARHKVSCKSFQPDTPVKPSCLASKVTQDLACAWTSLKIPHLHCFPVTLLARRRNPPKSFVSIKIDRLPHSYCLLLEFPSSIPDLFHSHFPEGLRLPLIELIKRFNSHGWWPNKINYEQQLSFIVEINIESKDIERYQNDPTKEVHKPGCHDKTNPVEPPHLHFRLIFYFQSMQGLV